MKSETLQNRGELNRTLLILVVVMCLFKSLAFGQSPQMINYQGVARNANGSAYADKALNVRLSLHEGTPGGAVPYSETRNVQTNSFGLFSIQFGSSGAAASTGSFSNIIWSNGAPKYLQVEMDLNDGNGFVNMGTNQLISVPYALFAGSSAPSGIAGGDLSGSYPNPNVIKIQNLDVAFGVPFDKQVMKWDMLNNKWKGMNDSLFLPYNVSYSDPDKLFGITNTSGAAGGTAIYGRRTSAGSGVNPAFSMGVWGDNSNGAGVVGTSNSSIGVYAFSFQNHGGYGFSTAGNFAGLYGTNSAVNGIGVMGEISTTGNAIFGKSTGQFGFAGSFLNSAINNEDAAIKAIHNGKGSVVTVSNTNQATFPEFKISNFGNVAGLLLNSSLSTNTSPAMDIYNHGKGAGINVTISDPTNTSDAIGSTNTGSGAGIYATSTKGIAGFFYTPVVTTENETVNATNYGKGSAGVFLKSNTTGSISDVHKPAVSIDNVSKGIALKITSLHSPSVANGVDVNYDGNGFGINITSTKLGLHTITSASGGTSLLAENYTDGYAVKGLSNSQSMTKGAVTGINNAVINGVGVYGEALGGINSIGVKGVSSASNLFNDTAGAVTGINLSFGKGVFGKSMHGYGVWGLAYDDNVGGVVGENAGTGNGVIAFGGTGGYGIFAAAPHHIGSAGRFDLQLDDNADDALLVTNAGLGATLNLNNSNANNNVTMVRITKSGSADFMVLEDGVGNNRIRLSTTGKGFFNGGMQTGGADMAEAFDVKGAKTEYEPGDVLSISTDKDREVEKSSSAYSTLVAGVYATKPGMLMSEENIDTDISNKIPMGVVGVIPTKVCMEGGEIKRGDLLVSSSLPGVAMKADLEKIKPGQVIGKALENFSGTTIGKIKVLVNVK